MRTQKESYDYVDEQEQYSSYNLAEAEYVVAEYIPAINPLHSGNPFIEALPRPIDGPDCLQSYAYTIPFDHNKAIKLSEFEQLQQLGMLQQLRFALPFSAELEFEMHRALCESYSARYQFYDTNAPLVIYAFNQEEQVYGKVIADQSSSSVCGFSLIGNSGSGKSSAVHMLVSRYPQVIRHPQSSGQITQIVYLVVNCPPNSNFNQLYISIAAEIDKALGITNNYYENRVSNLTGLHKKHDMVKRLIEAFAVGIIIFDEIQQLDFGGIRENTYESLLTLSNETKVAIAAIGTEEASKKMFPNERTARRVGSFIQASKYCSDREFFALLVRQLNRYYWFDKPMNITDELLDELYRYSKGIISHLITLYCYMNIEYIKAVKKPIINAKFVRSVVKRHFSGLDKLLTKNEKDAKYTEQLENSVYADAITKLQQHLLPDKQTQFLETAKSTIADMDSMQLLSNIVSNIHTCFSCYTTEEITEAFNKLYAKKDNHSMSETELTQTVILSLQKVKRSAATKGKKLTAEEIKMNLASAFQ